MTRLAFMALSTTLPGTSALIVTVRLMQIAEAPTLGVSEEHMSLVRLYVPAFTRIGSNVLSMAAVSSLTLPTVICRSSCNAPSGPSPGGAGAPATVTHARSTVARLPEG